MDWKRKWPLITVTCVALALLAVLYYKRSNSQVVATVGQYSITTNDVALRDQVLKAYNPEEKNSYGLDQLIRAFSYAEILKNHGKAVTADVLQKEKDRIDKNTLRPELLAQIKSVFKNDKEKYDSLFVLPVYVERVMYFDFFLHDPEVQRESFSKANAFLNEVLKKPAAFDSLAKTHGTAPQILSISLAEGFTPLSTERSIARETGKTAGIPPELKAKMEDGLKKNTHFEAEKWIIEVLSPLKTGEIYSKIVNHGETWAVVQNLGSQSKTKDSYKVKIASFKKAVFSDWLEEEKKKIHTEKIN